MRLPRFVVLLLFFALPALRAAPEAGRYLRAADIEVTALIPPAPANDSLTTAADLATVLEVQKRRTPAEAAIAAYFVKDSVFQYAAVIGPWFTAANLPFAAEFFDQVYADRFAISSKGKQAWQRPRPPLLDVRIHPCIDLPASGAYPSGHATMAFVWADLLAEIFPDKRAALRERAELVAWSRVIGGVHYTSDIAAGRMLGDRLAAEFLKVPAVREALDRIRTEAARASGMVFPRRVSEAVPHDSDDPAIWINPEDPARSLILGTDKHAGDGGLYVFDLEGRILPEKTVRGLDRPNNVDLATGFSLGGRRVDLAVVTERNAGRLRVFTVPDMQPVDGGGLSVFAGDPERLPMGIALYTRPRDGALFAIVSARVGPREGYLWQYRLEDDGHGTVRAVKTRTFGRFSGKKEIESVAVDAELGYVYYSDEQVGVRQYRADPDAPDAGEELALFATEGFAGDHEGISVFPTGPGTGYLVVSNQDGDTFEVFSREGTPGHPHEHRHVGSLKLATHASDGHEVTARALTPRYPGGLLVAMSDDRTFQFYAWADLLEALRQTTAVGASP